MSRKSRRALARHLVLTYLVLTIAVGVVLSLVSAWTVGTLEAHLQRIDMGMAVARVRADYLAGKDVGRQDRFFHGAPGSDAFPEWLRGMPQGFHKLAHDGRAWHAMAEDQDGVRYLLLRDYTDYERSQQRSHWVTVSGLAASLLLAFVLGVVANRRFVRPLVQLAAQVVARPELPPQTRLAQDYPHNEIGQLAAAFDETYNQLEQALERERLFTADVSHELRTPLMVVSSTSEILLDDARLPADQREQLRRIQAAAHEVDQQLAAYLMLSRGRADAGGFTRIDTASVAREQYAYWQPRAERLGMPIALELEAEDRGIPAGERDGGAAAHDAAHGQPPPAYPAALLRIVLSNLIRNALQHASSGTRILVAATPASLTVSDDGPGIPAERQAAVFAPFVHGAQPQPHNLGLGLSLVQRICQHQGWTVSLQSRPGEGCRFHIDLRGEPSAGPAPTGA